MQFLEQYKWWIFSVLFLAVYGIGLRFTLFSDDFLIVHQLLNNQVNNETFFRPFTKYTIRFLYDVFHGNTLYIHAVQLLLHISVSFLLYKVIGKFLQNKKCNHAEHIAFVGFVLFALYPFHAESIFWLVGIGSVGAVFFVLLSFLLLLHYSNFSAVLLSILFYFIALFFYESIILYPIVVVVYFVIVRRNYKIAISFFIISCLVIFLYFVIRNNAVTITSKSFSYYMLATNVIELASSFIKFIYRSIFLPFQFRVSISVVFILFFLLYRVNFNQLFIKNILTGIFLFFISTIPSVFISLPAQNVEGDRLLYFPSLFIVGVILLFIFDNYHISKVIVVIIYFVFCNALILRLWSTSSHIIQELANEISRNDKSTILVITKPDTYFGVPCFREGLTEFGKLTNRKIILSDYTMTKYYGEKILVNVQNRTFQDSLVLHKKNENYILKNERTKTDSLLQNAQVFYFNGEKFEEW